MRSVKSSARFSSQTMRYIEAIQIATERKDRKVITIGDVIDKSVERYAKNLGISIANTKEEIDRHHTIYKNLARKEGVKVE